MKTTTFASLLLLTVTCFVGLSAQEWRAATNKSPAPDGFVAGNEADGSPIYVIRAPFQGGVTVGKFIPKSTAAYVPWGGKENPVTTFEYFAGTGRWVPMRAHDPVPPDAIVGGSESGGERLFIIRSPQGKALVPGKLSEANGQAYIPWGGKEVEVKSFEILVRQPGPAPVAVGPEWVPADTSNPATGAIAAGVSDDGTPSYLIRAPFQGGTVPGKYNPKAKAAYVPWGGKENKVASFELYVGRGVWIPADPRLPPPPNAVEVGTEANGNPLLAIRAPLGKALIPGKYSVSGKAAYIPYGGKEVIAKSFEFLVREAPVAAAPELPVEPVANEVPMEQKLGKLTMTTRPKDVRARGGLISATGDLGKDSPRLNVMPVDVYRLILDQDATFGLSISGTTDNSTYDVYLLDEAGQIYTRPVGVDNNVRVFYGERPTSEPLYLFVVQKSAKPVGRYGFTLQETSYTIEGDLEGDFSNQESIVPMMWDTNPPFWTIGGSAGEIGWVPLIDARDAKGKVLARSEIVDPNDGVSQLSFSPPFRGPGDIRISPKTPTEGTHWKLSIQLSYGN